MTEQEERYVHFASCVHNLNEAWRILQIIKQRTDDPLIGPAFEFALIEYSKPYTPSRGIFKKNYALGIENVPMKHRKLHGEILAARNQIHAHSDLTVADARIYVTNGVYGKHVGTSKNIVYGTEKLSSISEIIDLIEKTLDGMYVKVKELEAELTFNS